MSTEQVKPGDLAIAVNCTFYPEHNNGLLVQMMRAIPMGRFHYEDHVYNITEKSFLVESLKTPFAIHSYTYGTAFFAQRGPFRARKLIPIHNPPGQDETLRWADVPRNDYADAGFMPLGD